MDKQIINPVVLGSFGSSYGINGWIRVFSSTEENEKIFEYQPWFIQKDNHWICIELEKWRHHNQYFVAKIQGFDFPEIASTITNLSIVVEYSQLPTLENGDFYWQDLLDCKIVTTAGYNLGKITNIMETGSNDVLVVQERMHDTSVIKNRLIPFINGQVIKDIDLNTHTIQVDWDPLF
ncbi:ribosome maturation factor RimM [Candidatus Profftia tarda]|uniref:Ribosome maturation factor RimM n=1 Tax=Candidatus Profftia tarda TaxID=1177216 RepID=A0A8E4GIT3_9ENTR|nr:ribosome maturation factor RimM [Candidatus Profftia tarda]CAD6507269.1 Ribosome maturation factor RimM [Candidatus Profftia tarda]